MYILIILNSSDKFLNHFITTTTFISVNPTPTNTEVAITELNTEPSYIEDENEEIIVDSPTGATEKEPLDVTEVLSEKTAQNDELSAENVSTESPHFY